VENASRFHTFPPHDDDSCLEFASNNNKMTEQSTGVSEA
jgi:hypothetical protein